MRAVLVVLSVSTLAGLGQAAKGKNKTIPNLPLLMYVHTNCRNDQSQDLFVTNYVRKIMFMLRPNPISATDYIGKGCNPDDPNLNECVVRKGAPAVKRVAAGDPKYRIPRLDPLVIESLKITQGTRQVGLSLEITNCSMYGLQDINFVRAKLDLPNNHCEWFFELDKLFIRGKYNVSGQVLILPITGNGDANITAVGVKFSYKYDWVFEKRANGLDYVKVTTYSLPFSVDRLYIHLDNLFNGDRLLGNNMNIFLNDNWKEIMKEMSPELSKALGEVFKNTLTAMADLVPYQTIFPRD